jgi:ribosomal protein L37E
VQVESNLFNKLLVLRDEAWYCTHSSGSALLKVASPTSNKESDDDAVDDADDDVAGSTLYIDNGKASRGHIKCVKCGHNKNPSAKLLCGHCGAYLREQTRARVAQRWEMLKEKANREGRLEDKVTSHTLLFL